MYDYHIPNELSQVGQMRSQQIFIGDTPHKQSGTEVQGEYVTIQGEMFFKIQNVDFLEPFFISLASSSDHWLFISSNGGLSAGRVSAEQAIFPYYTEDKLTENNEHTGSKSILIVTRIDRTSLWEPFSERQRGCYTVEHNLYKNSTGSALVFEEINHDLELRIRYAWRTSDKFGFVKTTWVENIGSSTCLIEILDGVQNLLPANVSSATQNIFSSLIDAYKRSELDAETGLAIFSLNSTLTDLAEPSESLLATTVAQVGLDKAGYLLSSQQLNTFRNGEPIVTETEVRGRRGAYLVHFSFELAGSEEHSWHLLVDTSLDSVGITKKLHWLHGQPLALMDEVEKDIAEGTLKLWRIVASADGVQISNHRVLSDHHFSNVMFNLMRGGTFLNQYSISKPDFIDFIKVRNQAILKENQTFFVNLPDQIQLSDLQSRAEANGSVELVCLSYAYLPLSFSRRHGDPSRPWNRFAINIKKPDGSLKLDYEGNWRDIFQNWEALAYSYPEFVESMISVFLNATTLDGYNPYRISYRGIDWETPEPDNPWANIGYWSDHQIIYLQKLMEISDRFHPGKLQGFLDRSMFTSANVPYRIKRYLSLLADPYHTIDFDWELEHRIELREKEVGTEGKLVFGSDGHLVVVSLAEKLILLLLAKLANFVPEGGIWMNTQRPEWNDANNALVGKGLSVVTLGYMRRYVAFCRQLFASSSLPQFQLSTEVFGFYACVGEILNQFQSILPGAFSDQQRRAMMDSLGEAGSDYRWICYQNGLSGERTAVPVMDLVGFLDRVQLFVEHSLRANKRSDGLYHAYNILHLERDRSTIGHLSEMLEGQVAILSSGLLSAEESLALLRNLRNSKLYQPEQHTYILYPDRVLPGFQERNCLSSQQVEGVALLSRLVEEDDSSLITRDLDGIYHFSGHIHNFRDVARFLQALREKPEYAGLVDAGYEPIRELFEETFHHNEFTGRSGSFFAYEGLGSVYWHMVAKLLLAVQENVIRFRNSKSVQALTESYLDIRQGLGFNRTPQEYGAFPTDPYSHTPKGQGAKQPGMTGMVKEEIITRQAELGWFVENGKLVFDMLLVSSQELLSQPAIFSYLDVAGCQQEILVEAGMLAHTICQTPVILQSGRDPAITVHFTDGSQQKILGNTLDLANSSHIFQRDHVIKFVYVIGISHR